MPWKLCVGSGEYVDVPVAVGTSGRARVELSLKTWVEFDQMKWRGKGGHGSIREKVYMGENSQII